MFLQQTLGRGARLFPAALAVVDGERRFTFTELHERVQRLAAGLHKKGLRSGERVAVLLPNSLEFLELIYACAWLGVPVVPLNHRLAVAELDAILADCAPSALFAHSTMPRPTYAAPCRIVVDQEPLPYCDEPVPPPRYAPDDVLGLFYTSGTTGQPKGVMLTHLNHISNLLQVTPLAGLGSGDRFLHVAPLFHMAGFQFLPQACCQGACQVMLRRFDLDSLCAIIQKERITHTVLIPTMINFLTLHPKLPEFDLSSLRMIIYGGSPIAPEVIARCRKQLPGTRCLQAYGLTETGPVLTLLTDEDHVGPRLLSCGRAVAGVDIELVDEKQQPVPRGQSGVVRARGLNIMRGYWNNPAETAAVLQDGWLSTGDIAYEDEAGYYFLVDRQKDMIITGGENVYSTEVEAVLYSHPAVREVAVIGVPDATWGELVLGCVVFKEGMTATEQELRDFCRQRLAGYKVPRRMESVAGELPKAGNGKILKRVLREQYWGDTTRKIH